MAGVPVPRFSGNPQPVIIQNQVPKNSPQDVTGSIGGGGSTMRLFGTGNNQPSSAPFQFGGSGSGNFVTPQSGYTTGIPSGFNTVAGPGAQFPQTPASPQFGGYTTQPAPSWQAPGGNWVTTDPVITTGGRPPSLGYSPSPPGSYTPPPSIDPGPGGIGPGTFSPQAAAPSFGMERGGFGFAPPNPGFTPPPRLGPPSYGGGGAGGVGGTGGFGGNFYTVQTPGPTGGPPIDPGQIPTSNPNGGWRPGRGSGEGPYGAWRPPLAAHPGRVGYYHPGTGIPVSGPWGDPFYGNPAGIWGPGYQAPPWLGGGMSVGFGAEGRATDGNDRPPRLMDSSGFFAQPGLTYQGFPNSGLPAPPGWSPGAAVENPLRAGGRQPWWGTMGQWPGWQPENWMIPPPLPAPAPAPGGGGGGDIPSKKQKNPGYEKKATPPHKIKR